jgi:hypothetical protein
MVVTIFAGRYNDFTTGANLGTRILREHVLPAVETAIRPGCPGAYPGTYPAPPKTKA